MRNRRPAGGTADCIDHIRYPRIFEAIFLFAPPASLVAFRGTCKALRDRVDARLFEHIVVEGTTKLSIFAPHGRLPGLRWDDDNASAAERALWTFRLANARVLDCRTKLDIARVDPALATALCNLQVVNRLEPTARALPAIHLVDVAYLTPAEGTHAHADSSISSPCCCPSAFTFDIPSGTRTSVTNVLYDPYAVPLHSFLQLGKCPDDTHSVIIYTARTEGARSSGESVSPHCGTEILHPPRRLGMLSHLVEELAIRIGNAIESSGPSAGRHTLVAIDEIDHALLDIPVDTAAADIERRIIDAIKEESSVLFPQEIAQQVPQAIKFMSRSEYVADQEWDTFVLDAVVESPGFIESDPFDALQLSRRRSA